ncbi:DUF1214 domain-containing protein, partial [Thiolapillus sp.]
MTYRHLEWDVCGKSIDGNKLYKLEIPRDMPVKQLWSLILYDADTWGFIYTR